MSDMGKIDVPSSYILIGWHGCKLAQGNVYQIHTCGGPAISFGCNKSGSAGTLVASDGDLSLVLWM